jgi:CO dehydrogenase/acetyl-CoA synthase delta subunit
LKVIRKGKKLDISRVEEVEHFDLEEIKSHIDEFKLKIKAAHKKQQQKHRAPRANLDLRQVIETECEEYFDEKYDEPDYLDDDDRKK